MLKGRLVHTAACGGYRFSVLVCNVSSKGANLRDSQVLSRSLFLFLERSISRQLASLYKGDPSNADEWLADEIYRAACDPGALGVFQ
jgi:hypothetical protein